jgi:hypothetical protein
MSWDTVDLLKIDIEGSEYDALLATPDESLLRMRRINIELHVPDQQSAKDKQQLIQRLTALGFRVTRRNEDSSGYGIFFFEQ